MWRLCCFLPTELRPLGFVDGPFLVIQRGYEYLTSVLTQATVGGSLFGR